jgi:hypothetical protein
MHGREVLAACNFTRTGALLAALLGAAMQIIGIALQNYAIRAPS